MKHVTVSYQRAVLQAAYCLLLQREQQIAATATLKDLHSITASQTAVHKKLDILSTSVDSKVSHADMHDFMQTQRHYTAQVQQQLDVKVSTYVLLCSQIVQSAWC